MLPANPPLVSRKWIMSSQLELLRLNFCVQRIGIRLYIFFLYYETLIYYKIVTFLD
jgi:hypothetical protein